MGSKTHSATGGTHENSKKSAPKAPAGWFSRVTAVLSVVAFLFSAIAIWQTHKGQAIIREGQVADRYRSATEAIGSNSLATRIGGLYELQRTMKDDSQYQPSIIVILSDYVRAPLPAPLTTSHRKLTDDVNLALRILGNTNVEKVGLAQVNLHGTNLAGADLSWMNLEDADLSNANLSHANLTGAILRHANLKDAELNHADFSDSDIRWANFHKANLAGADFRFTEHLDLAKRLNLYDAVITPGQQIFDGCTGRTSPYRPFCVHPPHHLPQHKHSSM